MSPRPDYVHYQHPWLAGEDDDDFGMTVPACACGEKRFPGEDCCVDCFIVAAHKRDDAEKAERFRQAPFSPLWRRFPPTPITPEENTE